MSKQITFRQLGTFLTKHGFVVVPTQGAHTVFEHTASGARVVIPPREPDDLVEIGRLATIRNIVVGKGVLDGKEPEELFDELLAKA